ncbi:MAG: polymerase subunit delta [Gaiellaceae bacterium]|nr:polymerase subunit delta [Gaiellaceae bacterium]
MAEELKPVYLIGGGDRPKIARALHRLRARVGEEAVDQLSATDTTGEEAVASCNALGLFGAGRRLVVVEAVEKWKAADVKAVTAYLGAPAPDTVLALVAEEVKKDSPLAKTCAKAGVLLVFDVSKRKVPEWVAEQFSLVNARADRAACQTLVELVGEDLYALSNEVAKLAAWADGDPIGEADVRRLSAGGAEATTFELTDAWGRRDVAAALVACESRLEHGDDPNRLLGYLTSHVGRVAQCHAWAAEGVTPKEGASRMRKAPFYVQKLFGQAANFGVDELRDAVVRLAELDLALKGGSRLAGDLELERALVEITRPAEPVVAAGS